MDLPGPAGEHKSLRVAGRGTVLCLGGHHGHAGQIARALAAGNAVLAVVPSPAPPNVAGLRAKLEAAGVPAGLLQTIAVPDHAIPTDLLVSGDVDAVCADFAARAQLDVRRALAQRPGAIVPLVRVDDPIGRLMVERTLSINTAAAGGDVQLLATT